MAIQSLDNMMASISGGKYNKGYFQKVSVNATASAAGRWHEFFTANGIPSAGAFSGTAGVATQMTESTAGALNVGQSTVTPDIKHLLNIKAQSPTATLVPTTMYLVDFLLYYPALVVTGTATTLNNTATLPRYTNGEGVMAFAAVQTTLGVEWHVEQVILNALREKKFTQFVKKKGQYGIDTNDTRYVPAYSITELPPLTPEELNQLAINQMRSGATE